MNEIDRKSIDDFTALDIRRMLAVLWRSELPIAKVMQSSRELGDEMTVRSVFMLADDDPLPQWIEALTEDIE